MKKNILLIACLSAANTYGMQENPEKTNEIFIRNQLELSPILVTCLSPSATTDKDEKYVPNRCIELKPQSKIKLFTKPALKTTPLHILLPILYKQQSFNVEVNHYQTLAITSMNESKDTNPFKEKHIYIQKEGRFILKNNGKDILKSKAFMEPEKYYLAQTIMTKNAQTRNCQRHHITLKNESSDTINIQYPTNETHIPEQFYITNSDTLKPNTTQVISVWPETIGGSHISIARPNDKVLSLSIKIGEQTIIIDDKGIHTGLSTLVTFEKK